MSVRRLVILLLVLMARPVSASPDAHGLPLLGERDLQAGGYTIVGLMESRPRHPIQEKLGNFYVDEPELLAELQSLWLTGDPAPMYACGHHYTVLLLHEQRVVDNFSINLEIGCGTVVTAHGSYQFNGALLARHADRYLKPVIEHLDFPSLAEGRDYLKRLGASTDLLWAPEPQWRDYDGEFRFMLPCPGHDFDEDKVAACISAAHARIDAKYPGETFSLAEAGSQGDLIMVEMKCSKAMHDRFNLYEDYWEWRGYEAALTLYWKQPQ